MPCEGGGKWRRVDFVVSPEALFRNPITSVPPGLATRIDPDLRESPRRHVGEMAAPVPAMAGPTAVRNGQGGNEQRRLKHPQLRRHLCRQSSTRRPAQTPPVMTRSTWSCSASICLFELATLAATSYAASRKSDSGRDAGRLRPENITGRDPCGSRQTFVTRASCRKRCGGRSIV